MIREFTDQELGYLSGLSPIVEKVSVMFDWYPFDYDIAIPWVMFHRVEIVKKGDVHPKKIIFDTLDTDLETIGRQVLSAIT